MNVNSRSLNLSLLMLCLFMGIAASSNSTSETVSKISAINASGSKVNELQNVTVTLPRPTGRKKPNQYIEQLITAAFATQGKAVRYEYNELPSNQFRLNKLLAEGETVDLAWLPADKSRTESFDYIPVPLYQGLHGMRLMFIKDGTQQRFDNVRSLSELSQLIALQERSWSDYSILKDNGLKVNGELDYDAMLKALSQGIGDYFPRSALTIFAEFRRAKKQSIVVEQGLLLEYPMYVVLFLSTKQPLLMHDLRDGFDIIVSDGTFKVIFDKFYQSRLANLHLADRHRIALVNKEIPVKVVRLLKQHIILD
ncbi:MAG: hypothetical protein ACFHVJ_18060 [Aestuariibacter sp.]